MNVPKYKHIHFKEIRYSKFKIKVQKCTWQDIILGDAKDTDIHMKTIENAPYSTHARSRQFITDVSTQN